MYAYAILNLVHTTAVHVVVNYSTDDQLYAHQLIIEIVAHAHKIFMRT
jgi:hypothetical protein